MASALKYIVDEKGTTTSVLVPLKTWNKLNQDFSNLRKKMQVFSSIKKGLKEIKESKNTGKPLQTLKAFLDESNN